MNGRVGSGIVCEWYGRVGEWYGRGGVFSLARHRNQRKSYLRKVQHFQGLKIEKVDWR